MLSIMFELFPNFNPTPEFQTFLLYLIGSATVVMAIWAIWMFVAFRPKREKEK